MPNVKVSIFLFILLSLLKAQAGGPLQTCTEISQMNEQKENFPKSFLTLPLYLTIKGLFGYGGAIEVLKVKDPANGEDHIKAISNVKAPGLDYQTDCYIKKVCKMGQKFELVLENGRRIKTEENQDQIKVEGHQFKRGSLDDFIRVSNAIDEKRGSASVPAASSSGPSGLGSK